MRDGTEHLNAMMTTAGWSFHVGDNGFAVLLRITVNTRQSAVKWLIGMDVLQLTLSKQRGDLVVNALFKLAAQRGQVEWVKNIVENEISLDIEKVTLLLCQTSHRAILQYNVLRTSIIAQQEACG